MFCTFKIEDSSLKELYIMLCSDLHHIFLYQIWSTPTMLLYLSTATQAACTWPSLIDYVPNLIKNAYIQVILFKLSSGNQQPDHFEQGYNTRTENLANKEHFSYQIFPLPLPALSYWKYMINGQVFTRGAISVNRSNILGSTKAPNTIQQTDGKRNLFHSNWA